MIKEWKEYVEENKDEILLIDGIGILDSDPASIKVFQMLQDSDLSQVVDLMILKGRLHAEKDGTILTGFSLVKDGERKQIILEFKTKEQRELEEKLLDEAIEAEKDSQDSG